jgi:hypothetical protein
MNPEQEKLRLVQSYIESGMSPEEAMMEAESVIGEQNAVIDRPGSKEVPVHAMIKALETVKQEGGPGVSPASFNAIRPEGGDGAFTNSFNKFFDPRSFDKDKPPPEELEDLEAEVVDGEPSPDSYEGETEEQAYERQIDTLNGMRNHNFDSETYDQGQDPQSMEERVNDQDITRMVEALQRESFERGEGGDASRTPMGMEGQSVLPPNRVEQYMEDSGVGRQASDLQNMSAQPNGQVNPGAGGIGQVSPEIMQAMELQRINAQQMQNEQMKAQQMQAQQQGNFGGAGNFSPGY